MQFMRTNKRSSAIQFYRLLSDIQVIIYLDGYTGTSCHHDVILTETFNIKASTITNPKRMNRIRKRMTTTVDHMEMYVL